MTPGFTNDYQISPEYIYDKKRDQMIDINNIISISRIILYKRNEVLYKTCSFILVFNVSIIVSRKFPLIVTDLTFYPSDLFL